MDQMAANAVSAVARVSAVPKMLEIVCRTTGMGLAAVARVTDDRWVACGVADRIAFGLSPGGELPVETTICHRIRETGQAVVIEDATTDVDFRDHPTPRLYGFRSYLSMPIPRQDGSFFGTLCAIDPEPHRVNTPKIISMFQAFAKLIACQLDDIEVAQAGEAALAEERREAGLREEFIAVLAHELRHPLQAISSIGSLFRRRALDERDEKLLGLLDGSVRRMAALIDDVLDFARGRLGDGLNLDRTSASPLEPVLIQVLDELRVAHPASPIESRFRFVDTVRCDQPRIGQVLSNLVANALTHGTPNSVVGATGEAIGGGLILEVSNEDTAIAASVMEKRFEPFYRNAHGRSQQGLGLGVYIACMVAQAHGGSIDATSADGVTRFTLRLPPPAG